MCRVCDGGGVFFVVFDVGEGDRWVGVCYYGERLFGLSLQVVVCCYYDKM